MPAFEVDGREASWVRTGQLRNRPLFVFAHGAGAPMTSPFMEQVADGLVERDVCVVRFQFPYMEQIVQTGARRGPDPARRLLATWRAVLDVASKMRGRGAIVIGGKSMGGRYASMLAAEGGAPEARACVYFGYPLHPPGRPEKLRADHLARVPVPQLFVQGTKDKLCEPKLLKRALASIPAARVVSVKGADHSLSVSRKDPMKGSDAWLDEAALFIREHA
ncbi:MAG: dienelactone hydrolase family protein [Sandaracinaceae bacterium]|nr:dienelactone hydrolase family protein [Sandaracinaceae bacterium]